jgi:hypothetical protein
MERTEFLSKTLKFKRPPNVLDVGATPLDKPLYTDVDRMTFARALAKRMVGRTGVLSQNKTELRALSSSELDQLADYARDELRNHLCAFEG